MDWWLIALKALGSAIVILVLTEIAKRNAFVSAVIIAFPLMTALTMALLYIDTGDAQRSIKLAYTTFWLILASTSFFGLIYLTQKAGLTFWWSFSSSVLGASLVIIAFTLILKRFGIDLLSNT